MIRSPSIPYPMLSSLFALLAACGGNVSGADDGLAGDSGHAGDHGGTDAGTDGGTDAGTDGGADSGTDGGTDGGTTVESEIAKIQQYDGYAENDAVTVSGIVTSPNTGSGFYMADAPGAWAGIWVYHNGTSEAVPGDVVDVTATLIEFNELTELDASKGSVVITGTAPVPAADLVDISVLSNPATAEAFEGVLVELTSVSITDANPDAPDDDFGEWEMNASLRGDDYFYDPDPQQGATYASMKGIFIYTFGQYKLAPRFPADVTE